MRNLLPAAVTFAALIVCGAPSVPAQQPPQPPQPRMLATADPEWEVTTVRPTSPEDTHGQHINFEGRRILMTGTTVEQFFLIGYGIQKSQLADLPDWARTQRWDVTGVATVQGMPSLQQVQSLMRKLLPLRFGLKLHHEQRDLSVFALTVSKDGPKLTPNSSDPNGSMQQYNSQSDGVRRENLKNTSMDELTLILQFHVDRPVVNQTGLKGRYDFLLQWTTDDARTPTDDAPPALLTAIQEQIGLKLAKAKAPVDVLVVDTLTKPEDN